MKKLRESSDTPIKLRFRYPEILIINPTFRRGVIKIRKEWAIPDRGFQDNKLYEEWYQKLIDGSEGSAGYRKLMSDIASLRLSLKKYPKHWDWFMYTYVTREEILKEYKLRSGNHPYRPTFSIDGDSITLRLYTNTTRKVLAPVLSEIYKLQKSSEDYDNSRERKKLPRDIKILRKFLETHSIADVVQDKDLTSEEKRSIDFDYERVKSAIRRLLKRIFPE